MSEEELEEQIVEQIKVLTEELGGTLKQLTRACLLYTSDAADE